MRARVLHLSLAAVLAVSPRVALAQQVFTGDPIDPSNSLAYPILPGLPLLLPGIDERFGTGDDVINTGLTGDVDLVVRIGNILATAIPPPSLAPGAAGLSSIVVGGGSSGSGGEATFTTMVSDGTGSPAYGNVITNSDLTLRPVTVFAFADLDGDGVIGPTNADGTADNALELQEATSYAGRQMGALSSGRFQDSLGMEVGAPVSMGGVVVALVAGAYTGTNPDALFTDGPLILTRWPFFPPLDPKDLLGGGQNPAPDPMSSNQLEWDIETNYLPAPAHPTLGTPFALAVDGSEPTTDQIVSQSSTAVGARVFAEPIAAKFVARSRPLLRVAPAIGGGRALVMPVDRAVLAADGAASTVALRVLPVDLFANVADPSATVSVTLTVDGPASIVSPNGDGNDKTETVSLTDAMGAQIVLDDDGSGSARLTVSIGGNPVQTVTLAIGADSDSDGDGVADDGNGSGLAGDGLCDAAATACDDNCPRVINPSQMDSNQDGIGDCCDGTCLLDPLSTACDECALPVAPIVATVTQAKLSVSLGDGADDDKVTLKVGFELSSGAAISPDSELVAVAITQPGSGGYGADLNALFSDQMKPKPSFRYADRDGNVDGVTKALIRGRSAGSYKMVFQARGPALADLAAGGVSLTLGIGDDQFSASLTCSGTATRLRCTLAP